MINLFSSKKRNYFAPLLLVCMLFTSIPVKAANLDSAYKLYSSKDYGAAASQFAVLLTLNWPKSKVGEIYDVYTECLINTGQLDLAETKINEFLRLLPGDPLVGKLSERQSQITQLRSGAITLTPAKPNYDADTQTAITAYESADYTAAIQAAKECLAKSDGQSESALKALSIIVDAQAKTGQFQEQIATIDQILAENPNHPLFAELRYRQGDTLSNSLKQIEAGRLKYVEAIARADKESDTYENAAYRLSEIARGQARELAKTDAAKAAELIAASNNYLTEFLNHPGADKIYPANAKRRIVALKNLKKYDEMEAEAARYLSDDNLVQTNEVVSIRMLLGEFVDFRTPYHPTTATPEETAIHEIKAAYYGEDYAGAIKQAKDFLASRSVSGAEYNQAQRLLVGSLFKSKANQELIDYVDQALIAAPECPSYADFRKVQADVLLDNLKQPVAAQPKYVEAMAHSAKDSDVYEWCCFRAGEALYRQATSQVEINPQVNAQLKTLGRKYMQEYLELPSKDRLYPSNVKRRMVAYNRLGQNDLMELEAARYLSERGDFNKTVYMQIMSMLSTNRSTKKTPDEQGALAAFEAIRLHETNFADNNAKIYSGITMIKSAEYFEQHGSPKDRVDQLRATGRKFLLDAVKDESIKPKNRLSAFYFLGDWKSMQTEAQKQLDATPANDSANRAELMNLIGAALRYQNDIPGALEYFDQSIRECELNPAKVGHRGVTAAYWGIWIKLEQKDETGALSYLVKMNSMPDCEMKTGLLSKYHYLLCE
ncbi:outer membrane protein assembly factor BamD [bacterium]|nr:outer membrane protein assembly factor BamD [bacterium]